MGSDSECERWTLKGRMSQTILMNLVGVINNIRTNHQQGYMISGQLENFLTIGSCSKNLYAKF